VPARRTGYHLRFSRVIYRGERLRCVRPGGRGLFGEAVLTEAAIESTDSQDFEAQAGIERRRWLCVTTRVDVDVCTAHRTRARLLRSPGTTRSASNSRRSLARRGDARTVIFGGDVNRLVGSALRSERRSEGRIGPPLLQNPCKRGGSAVSE
jgi:hypothetical protein